MSFSNLNVKNNNKYPEYLSAHRLCNRVRAAGAAPCTSLARRGGASDVPGDRASAPPPPSPRSQIRNFSTCIIQNNRSLSLWEKKECRNMFKKSGGYGKIYIYRIQETEFHQA